MEGCKIILGREAKWINFSYFFSGKMQQSISTWMNEQYLWENGQMGISYLQCNKMQIFIHKVKDYISCTVLYAIKAI